MVSHGSMVQDPFCVMRLPTTEQSSLLTRWHMHRNQYDRTGSVHTAVYFVSSEIPFATETVVFALKRLVGVFYGGFLRTQPAASALTILSQAPQISAPGTPYSHTALLGCLSCLSTRRDTAFQ